MTKEKIKYLKDAIHDAQCAQTEVTANMHEVVNDVEKGLLLMESSIENLVRCNGLLAAVLLDMLEEGDAE